MATNYPQKVIINESETTTIPLKSKKELAKIIIHKIVLKLVKATFLYFIIFKLIKYLSACICIFYRI